MPQHVRAKLADSLRPQLQMGLGLHIAQHPRQRVLHRRLHRLGRRIVPRRDRQAPKHAVPPLSERNSRARHGGLPHLSAAFTARLTAGLSTAAAMLTTALTARLASFAAAANLGMGYPAGERCRRRRQVDRQHLARSQVDLRRRAQLRPVRKMHLDPHPGQDAAGRVLNAAHERVVRRVVAHDQPRTVADRIEGLVRRQRRAAALLTARRARRAAGLAATFTTAFPAGAMLANGLTAAPLRALLRCRCAAGSLVSSAVAPASGHYTRANDGRQNQPCQVHSQLRSLVIHLSSPFVNCVSKRPTATHDSDEMLQNYVNRSRNRPPEDRSLTGAGDPAACASSGCRELPLAAAETRESAACACLLPPSLAPLLICIC